MPLPLEKRGIRTLEKTIGVDLSEPSVGDVALEKLRQPINRAADAVGRSMERAKTEGCFYDEIGGPVVDAIAESKIITRFAERLKKLGQRGPSEGKILYSDDERYKR
mgnify:FL=1